MSQVKLQELGTGKTRYDKKRVVECLVTRGLAEWVIVGLLARMIVPAPGLHPVYGRFQPPASYDAPDDSLRLPPFEIPGIHFQEPQSATWRREHRNVSFLPQV